MGVIVSNKIKNILEDSSSQAGRRFDFFIQFLIIISLVSFALESEPWLSDPARRLLDYLEAVIVAVFTLEYVARLMVTNNKKQYIFSFYGLIDLLAIAPFYITFFFPVFVVGGDARVLRVLRLFRLFRIFKIVRYNRSIKIFLRAFKIAKEELVLFFVVVAMMLYIAAAGIYICERNAQPEVFSSWFDSLWWAVVTLTTVGYGDAYPVTLWGRVFTFFLLMVGIGTIAVPSGIIASALSKARQDVSETEAKM